jgi:hypothetical protein
MLIYSKPTMWDFDMKARGTVTCGPVREKPKDKEKQEEFLKEEEFKV